MVNCLWIHLCQYANTTVIKVTFGNKSHFYADVPENSWKILFSHTSTKDETDTIVWCFMYTLMCVMCYLLIKSCIMYGIANAGYTLHHLQSWRIAFFHTALLFCFHEVAVVCTLRNRLATGAHVLHNISLGRIPDNSTNFPDIPVPTFNNTCS